MATSTINTSSSPSQSTSINPSSSTIPDEFRMEDSIVEIDSSMASAILYLRDENGSYTPEIALGKLKPALTGILPLLQWVTNIVSEIGGNEKTLSQGEHPLFSEDASGPEETIVSHMKGFLGIWVQVKDVLILLQSKLVQVETTLLQQEGDISTDSKDAAFKTLVGAINDANRVLESLWMDIVNFPQSTRAIQGV